MILIFLKTSIFFVFIFLQSVFAEDLESSFKREFIYLQSQKKTLESVNKKSEQKSKLELDKIKTSLDQARKELVQLEIKNQKLIQKLKLTTQKSESMDKMLQSTKNLEHQFKDIMGLEASHKISLEQLSQKINERWKYLDGIRLAQQNYIDFKGEGKKDEILSLGTLARYNSESGSWLAPIERGLWGAISKHEGADPLKTLGSNQWASLDLFMTSPGGVYQEPPKKTWASSIKAGGWIGFVIIFLGFIVILVALLRAFRLYKSDFIEVADISKHGQHFFKTGQLPAPFFDSLSGAQKIVFSKLSEHSGGSKSQIEPQLLELYYKQERHLGWLGPVILVIAAVSPLLGLLGTVTGMISTFDVINIVGAGDPQMLSGGISEALVTTQFGLIVAIPALLVGNYLSNWAKEIGSKLEDQVSLFMGSDEEPVGS